MKKLIFVISVFVLVGFTFVTNAQVMKGNGKIRTDERDVSGYNEIVAQGKFTLILTQGDKEGLSIATDENLIEFFQTRVDDNRLYITMLADIKKTEGVNVYLSIKELENVILLDEVTLKSETVIHFDELSVFSGGMSQLNLELFAASLSLELTDGTYGYLKGYTENLYAEIHDETEMNAFDLQTDFCEIKSTGLTEVMIDAQKELKLMVTGASNVYYTGEPNVSQRIFASTGFIVKRKRNTPR